MSDNSATTYELNQLAAKLLTQQFYFAQIEIDLLEKGVASLSGASMVSSEIASISNNIWLLIHELPVQNYWLSISKIITQAKISHTKTLAFNSISKRIASDWPLLDQPQKISIVQFFFSLQNETLQKGYQISIIAEVIIALVRLQWGGLLNGFIQRITDNLTTMSTKNILFNLQLIRRLLRESFDSWSDDLLTEEYQHFKTNIEGEMRSVMSLACFCLSEASEIHLLIPPCLQFLQQIVQFIPIFELFNGEILDILQTLLKSKQYGKGAMNCLKEIFAFKEIGITQEHHSRIARRLLSVLETEIRHCTSSISPRTVSNFDKQSSSTVDSFCSKLTVSLNKSKENALSPDIVDLIYLYLTRYIPSMDSRPNEKYFEIQSDRSTKLLFSKDLYDYFEKGFWRFVQFMVQFGKRPGQNLRDLTQLEYETQFRYLVCVKLILDLFGKLGISYQQLLEELIEIYIVRLAPLQKAFRKFYILFDLIMNDTTVYMELDEVQTFSEDYCQIYIQGMEVILKNRMLAQMYTTVLQNLLTKIVETQPENMIPKKKPKISIPHKINIVNRISWSLIHGFKGRGQGLQLLSINKIVAEFVTQTFGTEDVALKKCYSLNSKYILQAFKGTQFGNIIFSSLNCNSMDLVHQFNINLISNIILHPLFVFKDLGNDWLRGIESLLMRVRDVKAIGTYNDEFNRVYPAMFRLGIKMIQYPANKEHEQQLALQIKTWLKQLIYDETLSLLKSTSPQGILDVLSLKKVNQILLNYQDISALLLEEGETRERGTYWMLKHHIVQIKEIVKLLDFKYKLYSDYVEGRTFENFQIAEIVQFRENYNFFICNFIKLFSLRTKIQIKDQTFTAQKRAKIIKQRTQLIQVTEKRLFQDFEAQVQFKCSNYLNTALQYYKFLMLQKQYNYSDVIGQSIKGISAALNQKRVKHVEKFITAKLNFWKGLIQNFMEELKEPHIEEFSEVYNGFAQYSSKNAQLCLQLIERCFQKLQNHIKQVEPPFIWSRFMAIFKITFEKLFDEACKKQEIFKRLAGILYFMLVIANGSEKKLAGQNQGKKANVQVLFLYIREHVKSTVGDCGEQQDLVLQALFKERNRERFVNIMKDYKISLMRWLKNRPVST